MSFPEDFPARNGPLVGLMSIDSANLIIYIDMWNERVSIDGKTEWPLGGKEWRDMLKRNNLKLKKTQNQTKVIMAQLTCKKTLQEKKLTVKRWKT